jgi:hypothetical protein
MTDIRSELARQIRDRVYRIREMTEFYEGRAAEERDLAITLEEVAQRVERGEADDKVGEALAAARPAIRGWYLSGNKESEADQLRRIFNIETLGGAIALPPDDNRSLPTSIYDWLYRRK